MAGSHAGADGARYYPAKVSIYLGGTDFRFTATPHDKFEENQLRPDGSHEFEMNSLIGRFVS